MIAAATLDEAIASLRGAGVQIQRRSACGGGCIALAERLHLSDGSTLFCKTGGGVDGFAAEADGLEALRAAGLERVPEVLACGSANAFLLLEDCPPGPMDGRYWERAGEALAAMHGQPQEHHGWHRDNLIGASPQYNRPADHWPTFFAEQRLGAQLRMLSERGLADAALRRCVESVMERIDTILPAVAPSLVHGDLWSGNLIVGPAGEPVFIDPAVACGHGEVDLAMTELFGGFPRRFYDAYRAVRPIDPGYDERRDCYNAYHMLNHLLLFGGGYAQSARRLLQAYC